MLPTPPPAGILPIWRRPSGASPNREWMLPGFGDIARSKESPSYGQGRASTPARVDPIGTKPQRLQVGEPADVIREEDEHVAPGAVVATDIVAKPGAMAAEPR